jgi:hypothetical protein
MQIRAVACELPNPDYYLVFHAHLSDEAAVWKETDLQRYLQLQDLVGEVYAGQRFRDKLDAAALEALYVPDLSQERALQRLIPVMVEARRTNRSSLSLHRERNRVVARRRIGVGEGYPNLRQAVLCKGGAGLPPDLLALMPPDAEIDSLEARCDRRAVASVLRSDQPLNGPRLLVVTLPAHVPVYLSSNRSGEVVKEVARVWG